MSIPTNNYVNKGLLATEPSQLILATYWLHGLRQASQANGGEEIDGETRILGVIAWHQSFKRRGQHWVPQLCVQLQETHELCKFLEQNLDKDATVCV